MAFSKFVENPSSPPSEPPVSGNAPLRGPFSYRKFEKVYQMAILYLQGALTLPKNYRYSNMSFIMEMETAIEMAGHDCPELIPAMRKKLDRIRENLLAFDDGRSV